MKNYDDEYYFVLKDTSNAKLPELMADVDTAGRRFRYQQQPLGSPPMRFSNGFSADFKQLRLKDQVADVLFDGSNFMVSGAIRDALLRFDIAHMVMHSAIYVDDAGDWHENYWYVGFTTPLDCWDRQKSDFEDDPVVIGQSIRYAVYSYALNHEVLDHTPLAERLLFEMGGTTDGRIVCHQSLVHLFRGPASGTRVVRVVDA